MTNGIAKAVPIIVNTSPAIAEKIKKLRYLFRYSLSNRKFHGSTVYTNVMKANMKFNMYKAVKTLKS